MYYIKFKVLNLRNSLNTNITLALTRQKIFISLSVYLVISCGALTPPALGVISPPSCLVGSNYSQTCQYTCERLGYVLKGSSVRVCDTNGQWTGSNVTRCRGKVT